MTSVTLPKTEIQHVATFRDRGFVAPFTAPLLAGTRVRQAARLGIECVLPSPSGSRGVYILNWPGVCSLCKPTVHDTMLFRRFAMLTSVDSASIRSAALDVALAGHAGRDAAQAAKAAKEADTQQQRRAHVLLLTRLVRQGDPNDTQTMPPAHLTADLDRRVGAVLRRIAPSLGQPTGRLANGLTDLSHAFAPVGLARDDHLPRIPRLLVRLGEAGTHMIDWFAANPDSDLGGLGHAMGLAIKAVCDSGATVLHTTRSALADPIHLLQRWCADPTRTLALSGRCDSLLDGWEQIALLWLSAKTKASRRAILLEMIPLVPILPREVADWPNTHIPAKAMAPLGRITSQDDSWRSGGAAFALIERNEKLRAMSL